MADHNNMAGQIAVVSKDFIENMINISAPEKNKQGGTSVCYR